MCVCVCVCVCLQDSDSPAISLSDLRSLSDSDLAAELTSALRRSVSYLGLVSELIVS